MDDLLEEWAQLRIDVAQAPGAAAARELDVHRPGSDGDGPRARTSRQSEGAPGRLRRVDEEVEYAAND